MTGKELFQQGKLAEAIAAQTQEVKDKPTDADARYFLFVFLCFYGELDRADTHLDFIAHQDPNLATGSVYYRNLLASEMERRKAWTEGHLPTLPPDASPALAKRLESLKAFASGDASQADRLLEESNAELVAVSGSINGEAFDAVRDGDDLLAPVLEVYAGGRYLWLPFEKVRSVKVSGELKDLDHLWLPVELEDTDDNIANVNLPLLYPGSSSHSDDAVRLGRIADFVETPGIGYRGVGQKLLLTYHAGEEKHTGLLKLQSLEFSSGDA